MTRSSDRRERHHPHPSAVTHVWLLVRTDRCGLCRLGPARFDGSGRHRRPPTPPSDLRSLRWFHHRRVVRNHLVKWAIPFGTPSTRDDRPDDALNEFGDPEGTAVRHSRRAREAHPTRARPLGARPQVARTAPLGPRGSEGDSPPRELGQSVCALPAAASIAGQDNSPKASGSDGEATKTWPATRNTHGSTASTLTSSRNVPFDNANTGSTATTTA